MATLEPPQFDLSYDVELALLYEVLEALTDDRDPFAVIDEGVS